MIDAAGIGTTFGFRLRPQSARFNQAIDFRGYARIGLDWRVFPAGLASDGRDFPLAGRMHLVVHVPVGRRAPLARLVAGGDAVVVAVRISAVIDLEDSVLVDQVNEFW